MPPNGSHRHNRQCLPATRVVRSRRRLKLRLCLQMRKGSGVSRTHQCRMPRGAAPPPCRHTTYNGWTSYSITRGTGNKALTVGRTRHDILVKLFSCGKCVIVPLVPTRVPVCWIYHWTKCRNQLDRYEPREGRDQTPPRKSAESTTKTSTRTCPRTLRQICLMFPLMQTWRL